MLYNPMVNRSPTEVIPSYQDRNNRLKKHYPANREGNILYIPLRERAAISGPDMQLVHFDTLMEAHTHTPPMKRECQGDSIA